MILSHDRERRRVSLSTKKLESTPGDMIRNPKLVFEKVELVLGFLLYLLFRNWQILTLLLWVVSGR